MSRKKRFTLTGCHALVTGATAGLGAEFARRIAPRASRIVLVGRRANRLASIADELRAAHPALAVDPLTADLSTPSERERLAAWIRGEGTPLDFLVNNAGLGDLGPFGGDSWDRISPVLEVNVTALTHLTHLLLPLLESSGGSAILNVSSVAGFFPLPDMAVYAATKAYVTSFSEALRMELAPRGITVTALCPGPVPTEFFEVAGRDGMTIRAMERTHPSLSSTPDRVVASALAAVERGEPMVIPNGLLGLLVRAARILPFPVQRIAIASGIGPKSPKSRGM